ncbi:hypothetical protein FKP32DRAFT_1601213 [Trametes sanguinea]|nr:hypothetical protein FKP32DRAFT_1601213 [Trametes sanguinea]
MPNPYHHRLSLSDWLSLLPSAWAMSSSQISGVLAFSRPTQNGTTASARSDECRYTARSRRKALCRIAAWLGSQPPEVATPTKRLADVINNESDQMRARTSSWSRSDTMGVPMTTDDTTWHSFVHLRHAHVFYIQRRVESGSMGYMAWLLLCGPLPDVRKSSTLSFSDSVLPGIQYIKPRVEHEDEAASY